jgi:hypothetical protein
VKGEETPEYVAKRASQGDEESFAALCNESLALAAACAFTFIVCFAVNLRPIKSAAEYYYRSRSAMMPGSAEVLEGYVKDITDTIESYLGGM